MRREEGSGMEKGMTEKKRVRSRMKKRGSGERRAEVGERKGLTEGCKKRVGAEQQRSQCR